MPRRLTCPQGHQWLDETCPHCGAVGVPAAAAEAGSATRIGACCRPQSTPTVAPSALIVHDRTTVTDTVIGALAP